MFPVSVRERAPVVGPLHIPLLETTGALYDKSRVRVPALDEITETAARTKFPAPVGERHNTEVSDLQKLYPEAVFPILDTGQSRALAKLAPVSVREIAGSSVAGMFEERGNTATIRFKS